MTRFAAVAAMLLASTFASAHERTLFETDTSRTAVVSESVFDAGSARFVRWVIYLSGTRSEHTVRVDGCSQGHGTLAALEPSAIPHQWDAAGSDWFSRHANKICRLVQMRRP